LISTCALSIFVELTGKKKKELYYLALEAVKNNEVSINKKHQNSKLESWRTVARSKTIKVTEAVAFTLTTYSNRTSYDPKDARHIYSILKVSEANRFVKTNEEELTSRAFNEEVLGLKSKKRKRSVTKTEKQTKQNDGVIG
jgi:hypothetical protein